jgi:inner membrane protein
VENSLDQIAASVRGSQMLRLLSVGFLALLLQIPISMIGRLISERQERRQSAVAEVSSKWGNAQALTGPALVVPYSHRWTEIQDDGKQRTRTELRRAILLPERLRVRGSIDSEVRNRGIFSIPVYQIDTEIEGEFARPDFKDLGIDPLGVDWERAELAIGISDARAIQQETSVSWNGNRVPFLPGTGGFSDTTTGIHAIVGMSDGQQRFEFSLPLVLNGSLGFYVTPFGRNTIVELTGDHGNPSFQGNWLPSERSVSDASFQARWSVPFLGRNYPQAWTSEIQKRAEIEHSRFGVDLVSPVDHYRMAERSVKYAGLFILLTFATIWLIEVLAGIRVHPIQYLLLGGALCVFYLLELSLAEHLGFPLAYSIASLSIVTLIASYSAAILEPRSYLIVGAVVALLYGCLYVLLMNEDYALLIGSVGLFAILSTIMFVTRRVDWYSLGTSSEARLIRDPAQLSP